MSRLSDRAEGWWEARLATWEPRVQGWRDRFEALAPKYPRTNRIVAYSMAADTFDACLVLAAQALLLMVPMVLAVAAFVPHALRKHAMSAMNELLGAHGAAATEINSLFSGGGAAHASFGVVGVIFALASATSLTRRIQRIFERLWGLAPGRIWSSANRWMLWLLAWLASLIVQGSLRANGGARGRSGCGRRSSA